MLGPISCLITGIALILLLILALRLHAFLALTAAATAVALLSDRIPLHEALPLVANSFGSMMGRIGILIVSAAIIGKCIMDSGAADRIVRAFTRAFGPGRENYALLSSGFVLATPVFFDTVFYLLAPLARAAYARTKENYVLLICSVAAGGVIAHTLVPPTPGPLLVSEILGVSIGMAMLGGVMVSLPPMILGGVFYARWIGIRLDIAPGEAAGVDAAALEAMAAKPDEELPGLAISCLPFALPILLIAGTGIAAAIVGEGGLPAWVLVLGDKNLVFFIGAIFAVWLVLRQMQIGIPAAMKLLEPAIASGAVIAFITCAGGAFGDVLAQAGVGSVIERAASDWGIGLLPMAYFTSMLIRVAQGSATAAMTTAAGIVLPAMLVMQPDYHPMYLVAAIGLGAAGFSWMNDSGFWLFGQLTGLSEVQTLKTWTAVLSIMSISGFVWVLILSRLLPFI